MDFRIATAFLALVLPTQPLQPQSDGALRLVTERVVVFKDGHALIVKEGRGVVAPDGTLFTHEVPDSAVLGSFWASCEEARIRSLRAEWIEETSERSVEAPCASIRDLLVANEGREVTLTMHWPQERREACRIVDVLEGPAAEPPDALATAHPAFDLHSLEERTTTSTLAPTGGAFVAIERTGSGADLEPALRIVPVSDVHAIAGDGLVRTWQRRERVVRQRKRLTFALDRDAAGREVAVRILYFTPGMRWIPTYRLSGDLDRNEGELELQAEILNELEDLDGVPVDLVVGVPNFRFGGTISPLSLEQTLRNALQQAAPQLMGQSAGFSNALFSQRAGERRAAPEPPSGGGAEIASELAATSEQDLFVYTVPSLRLPRSARATVPLWSSSLDLRHRYTFDVKMVRDESRGQAMSSRNGVVSPLELAQHEIWHQLSLRNGSTVPWTTGAALVMDGTLPLGQELLTYTPVGGTALLPLTVAVDVRGDYEELQLSMESDATKWNGYAYARITKRGTARITNHKEEAVTVRVRLGTGGKVLKAEGSPQIVLRGHDPRDWQNPSYDVRLNPHSDLTWTVELAAGETKALSFDVEMFVR